MFEARGIFEPRQMFSCGPNGVCVVLQWAEMDGILFVLYLVLYLNYRSPL